MSVTASQGSLSMRTQQKKTSTTKKYLSILRRKCILPFTTSYIEPPSIPNGVMESPPAEPCTVNPKKGNHSERLTYYLEDTTHTNPGYSASYTTALTYICGFPQELAARSDLESEIQAEYKSRIQRDIKGCDARLAELNEAGARAETMNESKDNITLV